MRSRCELVLQAEQAECGLASLAMIAGHFGHRLDLATMRRRFAALNEGPSLRSVLAVADALGLIPRPVRLEIDELPRLALPAILHWRFDHFVVLARVRRRGVVLLDPAAGRRHVSWRQLDKDFTGIAVEFVRSPDFVPQASRRRSLLVGLVRSFEGLPRFTALMLLLLFITQILGLVVPVATQLLIDEIVLGQDKAWLHKVLMGVGLVLLTMTVIDALRRWIALYAGTRLATDSTTAVVRHLLHLPVRTVAQRSVGDLLSRLESLRPIRQALLETALAGMVQVVIVITTLVVMLYYSPKLTLVAAAALLVIAGVHGAMLPITRSLNMESLVATAQANNSLIESLRGFQTLRVLGLESHRLAHWQQAFSTAINAGAQQAGLAIIAAFLHGLLGAAEQLLFLAIGISGVISKQLTLGTLFAFMTLRGRLSSAVLQLTATIRELYLLRSHIQRVAEVVAEPVEPASPAGAIRRRVQGDIACRQISFRYPGGRRVLERFDCRIEAGESVALVGPSGAGKTTLLRLLCASLQTDSGAILVDGVELPLWDRQDLQRQYGVVLQNDRLFQGSVADNIGCFDASPEMGRIREAACAACIWDDLQGLPMTVHTPIIAGGSEFSGGQMQRILLARALYRQPRVLFLDEATCQLDGDTERRVLDNLEALELTIVSVAHRESAIARAGRIVEVPRATR